MTNPTQNSDADISDTDISEDWYHLERFMLQQDCLLPDEALDKQIIAAAHREIKLPSKPREYQLSWWRKLSLPLYIAAGFTFTVIGFTSLWQEPDYLMDTEKTQTVSVEINSNYVASQQEAQKSSPIKRELPELVIAPTTLGVTPKEQATSDFSTQERTEFVLPSNDEKVYTGTELSKATYPEKEAWVHKIIELMKKGENESALVELSRFKKAYPNYPIEEQIKVLTR